MITLNIYCGDEIPDNCYYNEGVVIEYPEIKDNKTLFPLKQCQWIYNFFNKDFLNSTVTIITNSPYILLALNNVLYAQKLIDLGTKLEDIWRNDCKPIQINKAICFTDGIEEDMFDKETGLFKDNELDSASDYITNDFKLMMELYRKHIKNDKFNNRL
jgi:hypothetical protein